jgi:hypothetical protein
MATSGSSRVLRASLIPTLSLQRRERETGSLDLPLAPDGSSLRLADRAEKKFAPTGPAQDQAAARALEALGTRL